MDLIIFFFFFQAEDGIRDPLVTGVQTCALPISGTLARKVRERDAPVRIGYLACERHSNRGTDDDRDAAVAAVVPAARDYVGRAIARGRARSSQRPRDSERRCIRRGR